MQFLRGDFRGVDASVRPPWAVDEPWFVELCNACGDCISVCPTMILVKGRSGLPVVDFNKGECEFCGDCVNACQAGALRRDSQSAEAPWKLKASIGERCITQQGVICRSCAEQCDARAIEFRLMAGRVPQPQLNNAICTGCGACVSICPVNTISIVVPQ